MPAKKPAKGPAPAVEFSAAPAEKKTRGPRTGTKNQPMATPIMDSSDENASKLIQAKREAEEKARLENIDSSQWEPLKPEESDIAPAAAASPSTRFNPTDLARRLGVLNKNLLNNEKAVPKPGRAAAAAARVADKEKYGPAGVVQSQNVSFEPRQIASSISLGTDEEGKPFVNRMESGKPIMGGLSAVPGEQKTEPYFTPKQINNRSQLAKQQEKARIAASGGRRTVMSSDEYLLSRMTQPTEADLLPPAVKSTPELTKQVNSNVTVTRPEANIGQDALDRVGVDDALPHRHGVEHNEITGEVRLTPIKQSNNGTQFPINRETKTFGPNQEVSADSFRPVPGKYHYIAGESVRAHTKTTDTWKRTNNNGKFGVVKGSSVDSIGTFYKHPETGQIIQTFDKPTDWRPSANDVAQAKEYYANHKEIMGGDDVEMPVLPRSILAAHEAAENPTGYNTAIEKHHVELFKKYNFKKFSGEDRPEKELAASNYAKENPEESKKWVADNLHQAISDSGEDHLSTMGDLEKHPDQIHSIFNEHFVVKPQRERDYKNAVKRGLVPKRVVPTQLRTLWGNPVIPAPSEEFRTRQAAQGNPVSRSDALNLGASEGR